jgi:hypothetical protein
MWFGLERAYTFLFADSWVGGWEGAGYCRWVSKGEGKKLGGHLCRLGRHLKCQMTYAGNRSEVTKERFREGPLISHCSRDCLSSLSF